MNRERVVFSKIGWMADYKGPTNLDPRPEGGARNLEGRNGHEAWNFLNVEGSCYGYGETGSKRGGFNLKRIDPKSSGDSLNDVLHVFLSIVPENSRYPARQKLPAIIGDGVRVVGWYDGCTVLRDSKELPLRLHKMRPQKYNSISPKGNAVCVLESKRRCSDLNLKGKGGMGRTNVRYMYSNDGKLEPLPWMQAALDYIENYPARKTGNDSSFALPEEIVDPGQYVEGAKSQIIVNSYERDQRARRKCIEKYGWSCVACGFDFRKTYGKDYIHVHHLRPLAAIGREYVLDPVKDLRPVCPNCHAMIHLRPDAVLSIKQLRGILGLNRPHESQAR